MTIVPIEMLTATFHFIGFKQIDRQIKEMIALIQIISCTCIRITNDDMSYRYNESVILMAVDNNIVKYILPLLYRDGIIFPLRKCPKRKKGKHRANPMKTNLSVKT